MDMKFLDFEQPIAELEAKIEQLKYVSEDEPGLDINEEVERLQAKCDSRTESIFSDLSDWQIAQLARHPQRPHTSDYLEHAFEDFQELAGDRAFSDDKAIMGGIARLDGRPVMVIGHEKGRNTRDKVRRNFGMPRPEGYRKALRLMRMAERFKMPVVTFVDTPGAYPGIGAEERGQSDAIARNLAAMAQLKTPIVSLVIGEGGSGGALAISVADQMFMLSYSVYSVISPEGCASILWKSADRAETAAKAMGITAERLHSLGLIDRVISEPVGGAHRNVAKMAASVKEQVLDALNTLDALDTDALVARRLERLAAYGDYKEG
ncbi:MAG: acetyl-CoA carboxylase carboxyl transferase subunit alpha [Gammaproteobacteria bacterium]